MTRFTQEVSGMLGDFWRNNALKEVEDAKNYFYNEANVINGIVRWKSNNAIPMDDMLEKMEYAGCTFNRELCNEIRDAEDKKFIEAYVKNRKQYGYSEEELYEIECAFGKDADIVDIFTGKYVITR